MDFKSLVLHGYLWSENLIRGCVYALVHPRKAVLLTDDGEHELEHETGQSFHGQTPLCEGEAVLQLHFRNGHASFTDTRPLDKWGKETRFSWWTSFRDGIVFHRINFFACKLCPQSVAFGPQSCKEWFAGEAGSDQVWSKYVFFSLGLRVWVLIPSWNRPGKNLIFPYPTGWKGDMN